ncbi:hypothetical protein GUITHDRAFT_120011 [Guillardia theta CCMP2712]|uniref:Uncharacterized protein n=2 Tax=Guillardia theta TaxID=55529 RepID=L1ID28_GUITC|nr:hypothetical protein GUITHDRAFT_120011 [Guillardia theta CCMP2712]EKX33794.1 hypothetical protein GUITHDRAFT_120011 [Guillardia theta CCMP2712]|eukprot:XP_005820774.1 hypothetical protein GUITHDRAFT_120011 [Guillardia theta CCMP2712]
MIALRLTSSMMAAGPRYFMRAYSHHAQNLDAILGGDLSSGPIVRMEEHDTSTSSTVQHQMSLEEAKKRDKAHLLAATENFLVQTSSNWALEFTTLRYQQERQAAATSQEESQQWTLALQLACGPTCMRT